MRSKCGGHLNGYSSNLMPRAVGRDSPIVNNRSRFNFEGYGVDIVLIGIPRGSATLARDIADVPNQSVIGSG